MITPKTMKLTLKSVLKSGLETPKNHPVMRTATGVVAFNICINATLRYKYVRLPQMSDKLKKIPIGKIALVYNLVFMRTTWRESRTVVKRARSWVAMVENRRCHVVSRTG